MHHLENHDKRTFVTPTFIPLEGAGPVVGGRGSAGHAHRHNQRRQTSGNNYYNRTKRKRESSSCSNNGNCSTRSESPANGGINDNNEGKAAVANGELEEDLPPWLDPLYPYSTGIIGLHEEIEDFYQWMVPSQEEHMMRQGVVDKIKRCIQTVWPAASVHIFGSFKTGLYLSTSDIDLVVVGLWDVLPLKTLERILLENKIVDPPMLKVLDKASVPIIKLTDRDSKVKVDISFNMASGLKAVQLIKLYKKQFPPLPKLIYVLKQFLLQRDLNEVFTGGLSSYCLIMMVVSFLQRHPRQDASDTTANLGVLLIEFFELYGRSFNYTSTAIRIVGDGEYCSKDKMEMDMGQRPSLLCIEDPLQPGNDVGKSSYGALQVKQTFDWAYGQLTRAVKQKDSGSSQPISILSKILQIDKATVDHRKWVKQQFPVVEKEDTPPPPTPPLVTPRVAPSSAYCSLDSLNTADIDNQEEEEEEEENSSSVSTTSMSSSSDTDLATTNWAEESRYHPPLPGTPSSTMSVSPATSEVGSKTGRLTGPPVSSSPPGHHAASQAPPFRAPFASSKRGYAQWPRRPREKGPDRADLDLNWRASAGGPPSDRSSNSGGSERGGEGRGRAPDVRADRADMDTNWRDHPTTKPPLGSKGKKPREKQKKSGGKPPVRVFNNDTASQEKCTNSDNKTTDDKQEKEKTIVTTMTTTATTTTSVDNNTDVVKPCDNDPVQPARIKGDDDNLELENNNKIDNSGKDGNNSKVDNVSKAENGSLVSSTSVEKSESGSVKKSKRKKKRKDRDLYNASAIVAKSNEAARNETKPVTNNVQSVQTKNTLNATSSKLNAGNRFSRVVGPKKPNR